MCDIPSIQHHYSVAIVDRSAYNSYLIDCWFGFDSSTPKIGCITKLRTPFDLHVNMIADNTLSQRDL